MADPKGMDEGPLPTAGLLRHLLCAIRIQAQLGLRGPRWGAKGAETELRREACNGESSFGVCGLSMVPWIRAALRPDG